MTRTTLILAFGLILTMLPIEPARAMPAGEETEPSAGEPAKKQDFFNQVVETRSTAG